MRPTCDSGTPRNVTAQAASGSAAPQTSAERIDVRCPLACAASSIATVAAPAASSRYSVAGTRPVSIAAIDSAAYATSSPCGMKMIRVTLKTRISATARSVYTAEPISPSCNSASAMSTVMVRTARTSTRPFRPGP